MTVCAGAGRGSGRSGAVGAAGKPSGGMVLNPGMALRGAEGTGTAGSPGIGLKIPPGTAIGAAG